MANEKRLIDANSLHRKVMMETNPYGKPTIDYDSGVKVLEWIEQALTVDAVPVVRCKDCKHAWIHPCGYVYCHRDGRNAYEMTFNIDSFCSYGERKEGAD